MKPLLGLGARFLFRLLLPGLILAAAFAPATHAVAVNVIGENGLDILFPVEIILFGWVINLLDQPVYMLYEGRRYWWCRKIRELFIACEARRLENLKLCTEDEQFRQRDRDAWNEAWIERSKFPLREGQDVQEARYPTRLGNLITEYEEYPYYRYGLDGPFYWYRIMVKLDKDLREEMDSRQASVDGSVYASFCLYVSGLLFIMYCIYLTLDGAPLKYISSSLWSAVIALTLLIAGFLLYRVSLLAHSQFGVLFKAVFDQYRHLCNFPDIACEVDKVIADPNRGFVELKEKNLKVWRYLRWNVFRPPGADRNYTRQELTDMKNKKSVRR